MPSWAIASRPWEDGVLHSVGFLTRRTISPSSNDWNEYSLPDRLFPLYYALRPVRLGRKYVRKGASILGRFLGPTLKSVRSAIGGQ